MTTCNQCIHLFITHDPRRRWGCRKFGFKSSKIPYQEVMATSSMIFSMKNKASTDFVKGKSPSFSCPENTKRSPHSNKSALKLKEKEYISSNAPAIPVNTNISLELRTLPSSLLLSILRWEGSSVSQSQCLVLLLSYTFQSATWDLLFRI